MNSIFRIVAFFEGVSNIVLLFFAVPMKRIFDEPKYVFPIGLAHGILFIVYIIMATMLKIEDRWPIKKYLIIIGASILPFGTFYTEKKYFKSTTSN